MAQKKTTTAKAPKSKAAAKPKSTLEEVANIPEPKPAPKAKPKAAALAHHAEEPITALGMYPLKTYAGQLNLKAIPLPHDRVMLVSRRGEFLLVENLEIVKKDNAYHLK